MSFPIPRPTVGMLRPFRKLTLDVDGVETALLPSAVFELQNMANGKSRLLIAAPPDRPSLFRTLAERLSAPFFILYVLHTPREGSTAGRYQIPALTVEQLEDFLLTFEPYLAGDARHDLWVHSATDGRTLIWDRHDLIYAEGQPLDDIVSTLEGMGFESGQVLRSGAGPHVHYYRPEFDADAISVLARFAWIGSELRPEDYQ